MPFQEQAPRNPRQKYDESQQGIFKIKDIGDATLGAFYFAPEVSKNLVDTKTIIVKNAPLSISYQPCCNRILAMCPGRSCVFVVVVVVCATVPQPLWRRYCKVQVGVVWYIERLYRGCVS